ncbi:MAG: hypothetical protein D6730_10090 [Bacteroidetes bacterium]|nr:MAG: hypothetical protein D6730_10090 [Bacteroidota bacterium]
MVKLNVKNLKEIDEAPAREKLTEWAEKEQQFLERLFKNYGKELTFEIIINKSSATYTVSASLNMRSKTLLMAEEDRDVLTAAHKLFDLFRQEAKKQKELERKDYLYKRKR